MKWLTLSLASLMVILSVGCQESFAPYNELAGLRVLAVRSEPADVQAGQSAHLDALVYTKGDANVSYSWSFCPWPSDPNDGFSCMVTTPQWQAAWSKAGLSGTAPSFEIGTEAQSDLPIPNDRSALHSLCEALLSAESSSATLPPDCTTEWKWTVRLVVDNGEERVQTVKDLRLVLDEHPSNQNPVLDSFRIAGRNEPERADEVLVPADQEVQLAVSVKEDAAELYRPRSALGEPARKEEREPLTFTWFVDQGSTERIRTTYRAGVESLSEATHNRWTTSEKKGRAQLFVVVRDHRGGVDFRSAQVSISD